MAATFNDFQGPLPKTYKSADLWSPALPTAIFFADSLPSKRRLISWYRDGEVPGSDSEFAPLNFYTKEKSHVRNEKRHPR